ncbi:MAG TPA: hypothetical protein PKD95_04860 [Candidatus Paceibacterota bacterium]|nr:hypothetical protein [Candidatus Paceibacterota bacterium]
MDIQPSTNSDLKTKVLSRIEGDALCPRSSYLFKGRECVLWCLWALTVLIGALAIAVTLFVLSLQVYSPYEVTHGSFWSFFIETLPFLWFLVFFAMVGFAVYNLRHTKNGYRYPLWLILGSSLVLSLAGGALLHLVGIGFIMDKQLAQFTKYYESQEKREQKIWQQPERGRLHGRQNIADTQNNRQTITFTDSQSVLWSTDITELDNDEILLLETGERVRLWGEVINISPPRFHACAALPWLHEAVFSRAELNNLKQRIATKSRRNISLINSPCSRKLEQLTVKTSF